MFSFEQFKQKLDTKIAAGDNSVTDGSVSSLHISVQRPFIEARSLTRCIESFDFELDTTADQITRSEKYGTIGQFSFEKQEEMIVNDLIWCLLGKGGTYICVEGTSKLTSREFVIDPSLGIFRIIFDFESRTILIFSIFGFPCRCSAPEQSQEFSAVDQKPVGCGAIYLRRSRKRTKTWESSSVRFNLHAYIRPRIPYVHHQRRRPSLRKPRHESLCPLGMRSGIKTQP